METSGSIDLSAHLERMEQEFGFISGTSTHADRLEAIRRVHAADGSLIDPHTADGVTVALRLLEPGVTTVVMETAQAAKFPETIAEALGSPQEQPESLQIGRAHV